MTTTDTPIQQLNRFLQEVDRRTAHARPVAIFDCDDTLIKGDIGESMFYRQIQHFLFRISPAELWPDHPHRNELSNLYDGLSSLPHEKAVHERRFVSFAELLLDWYFDQLAKGDTAKACSDIVRLFSGFTRSEVHTIAHATLRDELSSPLSTFALGRHTLPKGIRYIKESISLLNLLQQHDFDIWVVSGSNQWSVEAVCESIGIESDRVIAIDLEQDQTALLPSVIQPVPVLEGKVQALQRRIQRPPDIVISDSTYDIPLFNYSIGLKVLVSSGRNGNFFVSGKVNRDDRWIVIESTTLTHHLDKHQWQTQQSQ